MYKPLMTDDEFATLIETEPFAKGTSRLVFCVPSDSSVIVKKSIHTFAFSNFLEWLIWRAASEGPLERLLGRCISISESGLFLMMERLDDLEVSDYCEVPDVPGWFDDPKPSAFGKRDGTIKIRDYGHVHLDKLLATDLIQPPAFAVNARMAKFIQEMRRR